MDLETGVLKQRKVKAICFVLQAYAFFLLFTGSLKSAAVVAVVIVVSGAPNSISLSHSISCC